jgi:hypothetical protein
MSLRLSAPFRTIVVALSIAVLSACGGTAQRAGDTTAPGGAGAPSSPVPSEAKIIAPADACTVLPAELAKTLKVTKTDRTGSSPLTCTWYLDTGDKHKVRTIGVTYEVQESVRLAKHLYDSGKPRDMAHGRGANVTISETGEADEIGTRKRGQHYDEAYYFYGAGEIAGMTVGNGTVVIRRGNLTVEITAQGQDVQPPYTGKLRSKPLPSAEAKQLIDKTADTFVGAVKP